LALAKVYFEKKVFTEAKIEANCFG